METNTNVPKAHSEDYFGKYRDFWWNLDYLELMSKRLHLHDYKTVLDVGCGIGHWGQLLAKVMNDDVLITGIDREKRSLEKARQRASSDRFNYLIGDATALPFSENTFDVVTCQTVLIHLQDPKLGLREMLRVLKPGGLLLVAEPNNFANSAIFSSFSDEQPIDEIMEKLKFNLIIERGKRTLGEGFNSAGDFIPGYLAELKAKDIQVFLNDKTNPVFAPYKTREQVVNINQMIEWFEKDFLGWDREELQGYYFAGGGDPNDFGRYCEMIRRDTGKIIESIRNETFHTSGGGIFYLISARK